jgi:hypothetical protein
MSRSAIPGGYTLLLGIPLWLCGLFSHIQSERGRQRGSECQGGLDQLTSSLTRLSIIGLLMWRQKCGGKSMSLGSSCSRISATTFARPRIEPSHRRLRLSGRPCSCLARLSGCAIGARSLSPQVQQAAASTGAVPWARDA